MITSGPALLSAMCVSAYWLSVFVKAVIITPKIGKTPNIVPKEIVGFLSRLVMLPLVIFWIALPWHASFYGMTAPFPQLAWLGAVMSVIALTLTVFCWYHMGTSWRIGIDPKEKNKLVTDGPFKHVRHPIYALSMLLILGCFLSIQTTSMFVILCIHWVMFTLETYREENYLNKLYGDTYLAYVKKTNRFLPPLCGKSCRASHV
jgi:protein-S-isoprenylcysteine O-methyltransferase Ste14